MSKRWQIACFQEADGNQPVVEYIVGLTNLDDLELIFHGIQRLSRAGLALIDTKMVKRIDGSIFELRKNRHRIMFAEDTGKSRFVLLSAFLKETEHTPLEEITRAHVFWDDYLLKGKCEIFAVPFDEM
jgi:phage-related protein